MDALTYTAPPQIRRSVCLQEDEWRGWWCSSVRTRSVLPAVLVSLVLLLLLLTVCYWFDWQTTHWKSTEARQKPDFPASVSLQRSSVLVSGVWFICITAPFAFPSYIFTSRLSVYVFHGSVDIFFLWPVTMTVTRKLPMYRQLTDPYTMIYVFFFAYITAYMRLYGFTAALSTYMIWRGGGLNKLNRTV